MKRFALLLGIVLALGCGGGGVVIDNSPIVRMVNAWGGKTVNGSVGGVNILANGAFASAGATRVDDGTSNIVFLEGATALVNEPYLFEDGKDYTIILYPGGIFKLQEGFTPTVGNAAIRFANAAGALQPAVDIYTGAPGSSFATATLRHDDLAQGTSVGFSNLPAGTTKFFITNQASTTVLYEGEHAFVEGKHYTVIIGANGTIHFVTLTED